MLFLCPLTSGTTQGWGWGWGWGRGGRGGGGGGGGGALAPRPTPPPPSPHTHTHTHTQFFGWLNYFFYFRYPDLSLTTQTRFSIWQYWTPTENRQTSSRGCHQWVCSSFFKDNRIGNFGIFRESDLKMSRWHSTVACVGFSFKVYSLKFGHTWGPGCNLLM